MTEDELEYAFDHYLVHHGRDANSVICNCADSQDKVLTKFCWEHNLDIYENVIGDTGEPKFVLL